MPCQDDISSTSIIVTKTDAEIWMIRNQKGRRNVSTYAMVGLGLKLEGLLKQKGLENKSSGGKVNGAEAINRREVLQNSAELSDSKNIDIPIKDQVDARKEIANYANTSHDTVMKDQDDTSSLTIIVTLPPKGRIQEDPPKIPIKSLIKSTRDPRDTNN